MDGCVCYRPWSRPTALRGGALFPLLHHGLRWTIEGAHRIPVRGPVILACNHVSYLDPFVLAYLADRRHRKVRFLAKAELFDKPVLAFGLRQLHQIPVQRNTSAAAESLDAAVAALHAGECVCVFPEGTISLDLEPMAGKTGTARLSAASGVPVTPVGLWGAQRILFKGRKPTWRAGSPRRVVVGDPIRVGAHRRRRMTRPTGSWPRSPRASPGPAPSTRSARARTTTGGGCGRRRRRWCGRPRGASRPRVRSPR